MSNKAERSILFEEQVASTSRASDRAWLLLVMGLTVLMVGVYWFSDRRQARPTAVHQTIIEAQPARFELSDPMTTSSENQTMSWSNTLTPTPTPDITPNEQLIRRFYDTVVNRRQLAVMDDLFVVDFVYIPHKSAKEKLSLADLKQQLRDESRTYTGFSYTIEQLTPFGEWVIVSWSAEGTLSTGVLQTWSGHTAWRVVNGRIAQMLPYKAVNSQPYSANEGQ